MTTHMSTTNRLIALAAAAAAIVAFGFAAERASAAYTAKVSQNVLSISGDAASDKLALRLEKGSPTILQLDIGADGTADFSFDRSTFDTIVVHGGGGDDVVKVAEGNGVFTNTEKTTILGEGGADTLIGGSFAEAFRGGDGADTIDAKAGDDTISGNAGNDTIVWNHGGGNDTIGGGDGADRLRVNGSDDNEGFSFGAFSGGLLRFVRTTAVNQATVDSTGIERVEMRMLRGQDSLLVSDLTGTGVTSFGVDLSASGGTSGDGSSDLVLLTGAWNRDNSARVAAFSGSVTVSGLVPTVSVSHADAGIDQIDVHGGAASDTIKAGDGIGGLIQLEIVGNAGDDALIGGDGREVLDAGDGADFLQGNAGDDILAGGAQNDFLDGGPGADFLDCGIGGSLDTVVSDPSDTIASDCS